MRVFLSVSGVLRSTPYTCPAATWTYSSTPQTTDKVYWLWDLINRQMFCPAYTQAIQTSAVAPVWKCKRHVFSWYLAAILILIHLLVRWNAVLQSVSVPQWDGGKTLSQVGVFADWYITVPHSSELGYLFPYEWVFLSKLQETFLIIIAAKAWQLRVPQIWPWCPAFNVTLLASSITLIRTHYQLDRRRLRYTGHNLIARANLGWSIKGQMRMEPASTPKTIQLTRLSVISLTASSQNSCNEYVGNETGCWQRPAEGTSSPGLVFKEEACGYYGLQIKSS